MNRIHLSSKLKSGDFYLTQFKSIQIFMFRNDAIVIIFLKIV
jgi:hypothetical protein